MKKLPLPFLAGLSIVGMTVLVHETCPAAELYTFQDEGGPAYYTNIPAQDRDKFQLPAILGRSRRAQAMAPKAGPVSSRYPHYAKVIKSACKRFAVEPALVRAVIQAESNFDPAAVSPKGAMGLMQLMPDTARDMGVSNPFDPVENIHGGVGYLKQLLNSLGGDVSLALAAYNAGPKRVASYNGIPPFRETMDYIERVLGYYQLFKKRENL